jgi:hypothetical protein
MIGWGNAQDEFGQAVGKVGQVGANVVIRLTERPAAARAAMTMFIVPMMNRFSG